jgi:hypothetical protein
VSGEVAHGVLAPALHQLIHMTVCVPVARLLTIAKCRAAARWGIWAGACLLLFNCAGSTLNRGADFYAQGRYIDAAQIFEHSEGELVGYDGAERAHYGLYRGATLLALGDVDDAQHWLSYGESFASVALSAAERRALIHTLLSTHRAVPGSPAIPAVTAGPGGEPLAAPRQAVPALLTLLPSTPASPRAGH